MLVSEFFYYIILQKKSLQLWLIRPKSVHEGEGERKMREFKEKILSEEQAGRGEAAKTKVWDHFEKNISTWISGEHEAGDDEEQEQLDRVN